MKNSIHWFPVVTDSNMLLGTKMVHNLYHVQDAGVFVWYWIWRWQALRSVVSGWLALGSGLTTSTACSLSKKLSKAKGPYASL